VRPIRQAAVPSRLLVATLAALALSCQDDPKPAPAVADKASGQTFADAIRVACDAPEMADQTPETPESAGAANRAMMLAVWIDKRVRNQEVRALLAGARSGDEKIAALESGARRVGLDRCALAEMWRAGPESRP
jgi:hypothetical protein